MLVLLLLVEDIFCNKRDLEISVPYNQNSEYKLFSCAVRPKDNFCFRNFPSCRTARSWKRKTWKIYAFLYFRDQHVFLRFLVVSLSTKLKSAIV